MVRITNVHLVSKTCRGNRFDDICNRYTSKKGSINHHNIKKCLLEFRKAYPTNIFMKWGDWKENNNRRNGISIAVILIVNVGNTLLH